MLLTGDLIDGVEAKRIGLVVDAVPEPLPNARVAELADRIKGIPRNQLMMNKMMVNQALESMGLAGTQMLATLFDGIAQHFTRGAVVQTSGRAGRLRPDGSRTRLRGSHRSRRLPLSGHGRPSRHPRCSSSKRARLWWVFR